MNGLATVHNGNGGGIVAFTPADVVNQVKLIQQVMSDVMKDGIHFGTIPGCPKPSLYKPGAEKLGFVFRHVPAFDVQQTDIGGGHREYRVTCTLTNQDGQVIGAGVGVCSTMESKYRYRNASDYEVTDQPIPKDAKERKAEYRKKGFGMKQIDGAWYWVKYKSEGRVENPDIADTYNTVLKMAKKRAHVDAEITACAASDIFAQDVEDLPEYVDAEATVGPAAPAPARPKQATSPATATARRPVTMPKAKPADDMPADPRGDDERPPLEGEPAEAPAPEKAEEFALSGEPEPERHHPEVIACPECGAAAKLQEKISKKTNKPYKAYFCDKRQGGCGKITFPKDVPVTKE